MVLDHVLACPTLAEEYGISHGSAERALKILQDEGLIYSVVGKGAYVKRS
jgi:DNA-binding GntR family transcriptional regulator